MSLFCKIGISLNFRLLERLYAQVAWKYSCPLTFQGLHECIASALCGGIADERITSLESPVNVLPACVEIGLGTVLSTSRNVTSGK